MSMPGYTVEGIMDHSIDWIRIMYRAMARTKLEDMKARALIAQMDHKQIMKLKYGKSAIDIDSKPSHPSEFIGLKGVKYVREGKK